jgi:PAS domain S-box-containing protein
MMKGTTRRAARLLAIAVLTGVGLGLRFAGSDTLTPLLVVPTLLGAVWFGRLGGALTGSLGIALAAASQTSGAVTGGNRGVGAYLIRLAAYAAIGYLVGWLLEERRRAAESEALNAAALRSTLDGIVIMDSTGRIMEFNPSAERTFGHQRARVLGRELADVLIPARYRQAHREALARYLTSGQATILDRRIRMAALHADGTEVPVELTVTRVADRPVFTGYVRDLTTQLRGEADREELLARERAARTAAENAQQRSRTLTAEALEAEQAARRRISEALHDDAVQTLLAASQDVKEALQGQPESLERAAIALDQTIGRLREAVFELHPIALEYGGLEAALKAIANYQGRRGQYQARVRVSRDAAGTHDLLIVAVARELLTNVAKHASAKQALLSVARTESNIVLQVSDDGRGMQPGDRRAALTLGHIGLASNAERVAAMGGTLEIISAPGEGTVVRALLPTNGTSRRQDRRPPADSTRPEPFDRGVKTPAGVRQR